jgi:hypothetical protein
MYSGCCSYKNQLKTFVQLQALCLQIKMPWLIQSVISEEKKHNYKSDVFFESFNHQLARISTRQLYEADKWWLSMCNM